MYYVKAQITFKNTESVLGFRKVVLESHTEPKEYRPDGRFWPVDLCCAVVKYKPASLKLMSIRSDNTLLQ
jgi:hypothetical protein